MNPQTSRIGQTLGPSRFDEESREYLQRRLRLLTGVVAMLTGALWLLFVVVESRKGQRGFLDLLAMFGWKFPNAVLTLMVAGSTGSHIVLRMRALSTRVLNVVDAVFLLSLLVPCLWLYGRMHFFAFSGFAVAVPFMGLFILARAVLVPSGPWSTLLLSAIAPIGVLLLQMRAGGSFAFPAQAYSHGHFVDMVVQNQILLWGAVAVAATASRVNLGLRRARFDARKIGQYRIERRLGAGAMGEVYLATHSLLKRPTAIKMLRPEIAGERTLRRFEHEVRQTSRLRHPNTVVVYDYGHTAEGVFYYAMELLEGADLRRVIQNTGPMPSARVLHVLDRLCASLAEAHELGIVHRDIKPDNAMLCRLGGEVDVVKLLDFGLVKDLNVEDPELGGDAIAGTPETLAPEVISGEPVSQAADLYALGVVGAFLLGGEMPFRGRSTQEVLRAHLRGRPVLPEPSPDPELTAVLVDCMQRDPRQRPSGVLELRRRLRACGQFGRWTDADARDWWATRGEALAPEAVTDTGSATTVLGDTSATILMREDEARPEAD